MGRQRILGDADWGGFIGRLLGFPGTGAGGWDALQGHAVAIRGCQRCRGQRPWGRRGCSRRLPCPHDFVTGKMAGRKGEKG
jgi:hypothetical protein